MPQSWCANLIDLLRNIWDILPKSEPNLDATVSTNEVLEAAASRVLRALARVLLRYGVSVQAFIDLSKRAYIAAATRDMALPNRKMTQSRLALVTGLTRKDVARLSAAGEGADERALARINRAGRVVAGWRRDAAFCDAGNAPAPLRLDGERPSFADLVRRYSGDIPYRAVLDELARSGTVVVDGGTVSLIDRGMPSTDEGDKLALLGIDVSDLVDSITHNLQADPAASRFQRKVMYDNLPREAVDEFRRLAADQSQRLLEQFDHWLAQRDRDASGAAGGTGRVRAGVGIYLFEEDLQSSESGRQA